MTREEQTISNLKKLKSFHNGSYGADIDRAIKALEQEPCDDEYIKIPRKALKYRTAGMVAYNAEWLKKNWQMEMDIVCGVKPCEDAISRQAVLDTEYQIKVINDIEYVMLSEVQMKVRRMPSAVIPEEQEAIDKYIKSISKPTLVNFWDLTDDDLISRQDTLNAIIKRLCISGEKYLLESERVIYQQILAMPSVAIPSADMFSDLKAEISVYENGEQSIDEMLQGIKSIISIYER